MSSYRLCEIFDLQMGKTPSRDNPNYWNDGMHPWVSIADMSTFGKYVGLTKECITESGVIESGIKKAPANTVIMSFKLSLGKVAITVDPTYTNEAIMAFVDNGVVDIRPDYLYYLFLSKDWNSGINKAVMGVTLNKATLSEYRIEIPDLTEQETVIHVMDHLSELLALRKDQLVKIDLMVKSRFVEMFGDPVTNPMGWEDIELHYIAGIVSGITKGRKPKSPDLTEVSYMAVSNVKAGYIDLTNIKSIMATQDEIELYRLFPGDVLMTEGGDPDKLGRGAIIHEPPQNCIHQNHVFRVRLKGERIATVFFAEYLQHDRAKQYFLRCAKQTTGIASINMTQLKAMPVFLPPLVLQRRFAAFVAQADKSKFEIQQSLDKLELQYNALMQKYFD
ncbi:MAG: restriction endonuclease subunit S [Lachnospiraceae bacterium]|nr:restriction endonuclease subunit S [Lachnospiraceae bacterium]